MPLVKVEVQPPFFLALPFGQQSPVQLDSFILLFLDEILQVDLEKLSFRLPGRFGDPPAAKHKLWLRQFTGFLV